MSERGQPNFSGQEAQPGDENYYDDILTRDTSIRSDPAEVDGEYGDLFRWYQENVLNQEEPNTGLSNDGYLPQLDRNEIEEGQEEVSNFPDAAAAHDHSNQSQTQTALSDEEQEAQSGREEGSTPQDSSPVTSHTSITVGHPPSYFLEQFDDDLYVSFDLDACDENKLGPLFPSTEFQERSDELDNEQNAVPAETSISNEEPGTSDLFNGEFDSRFHEAFEKEREEIAKMLKIVSAMESASQEQPQESLQNLVTADDTFDPDQPQVRVPDTGYHSPIEPNNDFEYGGEDPSIRETTAAPDSFGEIQPEDGLTDSQYQPDFQFDMTASEDWQNLVADGSFSQLPYIDPHDEQRIVGHAEIPKQSGTWKHSSRLHHIQSHTSPVYHNTSAASPSLHSVGNGEEPFVDTPGIDSGYGTLNPSREATFGPLPATPRQTSSAVQHSGLGNMNGGLDSNQSPDTYNVRTEGAQEELAEDDQGFDPADDLNFYPEDPITGVIESRPRNGWGRTGTRNGVEVWFNPETEQWQESASHHSYRQVLIARAQAEHPGQTYLHPDETDGLPHGETAFYLPHQNFGPERDDCPDDCFVWPADDSEDEEARQNPQAKKRRKRNPRPRQGDPGFWFEDNKILLDPHNNPVKKHPGMPLTLSSMTEGYKLDLMRILNAAISQKDEWARMPRWIRRRVPKTDKYIKKYIGSPNTHVNMPSQRFRDAKGAVAGNPRDGTKNIKEGLKAFFAENGFDPSLTGSTRGFGRDLLSWEQELVKLGNRGMHPRRAGGTRGLDEETRSKNMEKLMKRIEKGRKKAETDAAKTGDASGKRPSEDQDGEDQNLNPAGRKAGDHPRTSRGNQASSRPQRYGTYGSVPTLVPSANTLAAGSPSYYGTYGAAPSPYQNTNAFGGYQQAPSLGNNQYIRNKQPSYPGIGNELRASLNQPEQGSREQTWSAQGPVMQNYHPGGRYQPQHDQPPGHMNNSQYGPPVQHQGVSNGLNDAPKYRGSTLGPGGRNLYQAPKQVLGRRGRGDTGEAYEVIYRKEQEAAEAGRRVQSQAPEYHAGGHESGFQVDSDSEDDAAAKRRRNNRNAGTDPRPQRRPQNGRAPRPQYYGAAGAPMPLILPEGSHGTVPHAWNLNGNAGVQSFGSYYQNGWTANTGLGGQASHGNTPYGDVYGTHGLVATSHNNGYQGMSGMQDRHDPEPTFDPVLSRRGSGSHAPQALLPQPPQNINDANVGGFGDRFEGYAPPQTLGKRDRPHPESESHGNPLGREGKRRRMPRTEGYNLPPGTQRQAEKKLRKSKRDEHVSPPVFNIESGGHNAPQAFQVVAAPEIDEVVPTAYPSPQVAGMQGLEPPHVPAPAPFQLMPHLDARNMPPTTEWECMSLREALEYTRWAYEEWTGTQAPVTDRLSSYNAQFGVIFQAFSKWWGSGSNPERSQPLPWLVQLSAWEGAVSDWMPPVENDLLYECKRRGFSAPRNLDGSLQRR